MLKEDDLNNFKYFFFQYTTYVLLRDTSYAQVCKYKAEKQITKSLQRLLQIEQSWEYSCQLKIQKKICTLGVSLRTADVSPCSSSVRDVLRGGMSATQ